MYHYVRDPERTPYQGIMALSTDGFSRQVAWLQEHYRLLDYPTFLSFLRAGKGPDEPTALLTFDDGFSDHYTTVFPVLRERNLSGAFFPCDGAFTPAPELLNVHKVHILLSVLGEEQFERELKEVLERQEGGIVLDRQQREGLYVHDIHGVAQLKRLLNYELPYPVVDEALHLLFTRHVGDAASFAKSFYLSPAQITEMAKAGMTFGAHTRSHRVLSRLTASEQRKELQDGVRLVRACTGQEHVPFCYPYGLSHTYNADTLSLLDTLGYGSAVTVGRASVDFAACKPLEIPRFDTNEFPPSAARPPER